MLNNCILVSRKRSINGGTGVLPNDFCFTDGEASLAVRKELAQGAVCTSLVGYSLTYNTLDNNKNPTRGMSGRASTRISPASAAT